MTNDLFFAILAMDAYNRGYGAGLAFDPTSTQIGTANLSTDSSVFGLNAGGARIDEAVSFFAQAYTLSDGRKVISYRGTDNFNALDPNGDIYTGWPIGGGSYSASQAELFAHNI